MKNRDALVSLLLKVNDLAVLGRELDVDNVNDLADFMDINGVCAVVRCKDCKFFCPYEGEEHKGDCAELVGLESCVYEDDYCSYGERKGEMHG